MENAYWTLQDRVELCLNKLSDDDLAVLAYALSPNDTTPFWGRTSLMGSLIGTMGNNFPITKLIYDGNGGYMLMRTAQAIEQGEL